MSNRADPELPPETSKFELTWITPEPVPITVASAAAFGLDSFITAPLG